jgi:large conductance mechanosensitive channel
MGWLQEFKQFALRGNAIDLAVGVIIGGAFNKITTSLVNDVIMPPIGKVLSLGGKAASFKDWYVPLFDANDATLAKLPANYTLTDIQAAKLPVFAYGSFLATVIDFLFLAFCVFMMVKLMNMAFKRLDLLQKQEAAAAPPETPADVKVLMEIRDLLKTRP